MTEVLGDLVGCAYLIEVIVRSVEELIVNMRAILLRFMECGLFLAAHNPVLFTAEVQYGTASVTRGRSSNTSQSMCADWWRCASQR